MQALWLFHAKTVDLLNLFPVVFSMWMYCKCLSSTLHPHRENSCKTCINSLSPRNAVTNTMVNHRQTFMEGICCINDHTLCTQSKCLLCKDWLLSHLVVLTWALLTTMQETQWLTQGQCSHRRWPLTVSVKQICVATIPLSCSLIILSDPNLLQKRLVQNNP